ncbi:TetR family transcriptional regulator [Rhizobium sp. ICMP 5592]|uniref:TetR family transcriptional regulator n=1 Tax=Rhizobium sp. ICMP 5592 TaxID=2292445 RepID=UPI001294AF3F|nr:TetR family transcriptional regulator [Rhizobium sp. ICMP 5592]MQB46137.1 TetR/AcrR family transcriptional regulator [Rhizobium sp. ICMP 5592]
MARDPEPTKRRLLDAARDEFAASGLAGARVDAIAAAAGCNKQLIYQHFGSKDGLFDAVFEQVVAGFVDNVPITPDDLGDYAGRLFDYYRDHPKLLQLATWYRLERELTSGLSKAASRVAGEKIAAIQAAQDTGRVSKKFSAGDLLAIVVALSQVGSPISAEMPADETQTEATRAMIVRAVAELASPK